MWGGWCVGVVCVGVVWEGVVWEGGASGACAQPEERVGRGGTEGRGREGGRVKNARGRVGWRREESAGRECVCTSARGRGECGYDQGMRGGGEGCGFQGQRMVDRRVRVRPVPGGVGRWGAGSAVT